MHLKISSGKRQPFCPAPDMFKKFISFEVNNTVLVTVIRFWAGLWKQQNHSVTEMKRRVDSIGRWARLIPFVFGTNRRHTLIVNADRVALYGKPMVYYHKCACNIDKCLEALLLYHGWIITPIIKCGMKLLFHSQTSTVAPLNFGNG